MIGALVLFGGMAIVAGIVTLLDGISYRRERKAAGKH